MVYAIYTSKKSVHGYIDRKKEIKMEMTDYSKQNGCNVPYWFVQARVMEKKKKKAAACDLGTCIAYVRPVSYTHLTLPTRRTV